MLQQQNLNHLPSCESQYQYDHLVIRTNCVSAPDPLACLRSLNARYLQEKNYNTPFPGAEYPPLYLYGPTIDDGLIVDYTYRLFDQGRFIKVLQSLAMIPMKTPSLCIRTRALSANQMPSFKLSSQLSPSRNSPKLINSTR